MNHECGLESGQKSDRVLVDAFLRGQDDAFFVLHERYIKVIEHAVRTVTQNAAEVEDACSEAAIDLLRSLPRWEDRGQGLGAFVKTVASRKAIDLIRKRIDRNARRVEIDEEVTGGPRGTSTDPIEITFTKLQIEAVKECVSGLDNANHRLAVGAFFLQRYTYGEIAEEYGIPILSVSQCVARGRKHLVCCLCSNHRDMFESYCH